MQWDRETSERVRVRVHACVPLCVRGGHRGSTFCALATSAVSALRYATLGATERALHARVIKIACLAGPPRYGIGMSGIRRGSHLIALSIGGGISLVHLV